MRRFLRNDKGQTALEYTLMIAVVFSLGVTFLKKADELLVSSPNSIFGRQLSTYKSQLQNSASNRYKTLPFRLK